MTPNLLIFISVIGLIFALLIEAYNYHRFVKAAEGINTVGEAFTEGFSAVSAEMIQRTVSIDTFEERLMDVERSVLIADQNAAIVEIMVDLLSAALNIEDEKWKRVGRLQRLGK